MIINGFFTANVTGLYYFESNKSLESVTDVNLIDRKDKKYLLIDMNSDDALYVYPGQADIKSLPQRINKEKVIGVYPIQCGNDNYVDRVLFFANYDGEEQREYLKRIQEEISESDSSDELRALPL